MPKNNTPQQEIPFSLEGNVANRNLVREISKNADYMRKVDISLIRIRPDIFNARIKPKDMSEEMWNIVLMVPDLADKILANNGPADPLLGDFHTDGYFYLTNGERRLRGMLYLLASGHIEYPDGESISSVYVILNPPGTTELERRKKMYTTNDNLPFTVMQKAHYFASFTKAPYNLTHDEIGQEFKVSRQTIDNYILATELPVDVQEKLDTGEINITAALAGHRKANPKRKVASVDLESGEILTEVQERKLIEEAAAKEKIRGDEDEFIQEDNSVNFGGSKGGPKGEGSGAVVIGKDSIYMDAQKLALWKQFINRYEESKRQVIAIIELGDISEVEEELVWENELASRLKNEYNLSIK